MEAFPSHDCNALFYTEKTTLIKKYGSVHSIAVVNVLGRVAMKIIMRRIVFSLRDDVSRAQRGLMSGEVVRQPSMLSVLF